MKVGEIWIYKGKIKPSEDGNRWTEDPYCSYYMDKVRIVDLDWKNVDGDNRWGQIIGFEALEGEPHPMEAVYAMPIALFLKNYRKDYNESR